MDNTPLRRALLGAGFALGAYVGVWAYAAPDVFYRSFPGFDLHWIAIEGPFDEHTVRDVGALYIGLAAASLAAAWTRSALPGRVVGLAWAVFGVLHFGFHATHPEGTTGDRIGTLVSLGLSALIGLLLLVPAPRSGMRSGNRPAAIGNGAAR